MTTVFALLGAKALYLLIGWMLAAIIAQDLSDLKGYGEKPGLATGLLLSIIAVVVWLAWPARQGSAWARRIKVPDLVTAVAAFVVLVAVVFLNWYSNGSKFFDEGKVYDVLLPIGAALCYAQLHVRGRAEAPSWVGPAAVGAGGLAVIVTLVQIFDKPDGASLSLGFFVALVGSLVMTAAAAVAMRADRTTGAASTMAEARSQAAGAA